MIKKINELSIKYKVEIPENVKERIYEIDEKINKLNNEYKRKKSISIDYIIKKGLHSFDIENQIEMEYSKETLKFYEKWWNSIGTKFCGFILY